MPTPTPGMPVPVSSPQPPPPQYHAPQPPLSQSYSPQRPPSRQHSPYPPPQNPTYPESTPMQHYQGSSDSFRISEISGSAERGHTRGGSARYAPSEASHHSGGADRTPRYASSESSHRSSTPLYSRPDESTARDRIYAPPYPRHAETPRNDRTPVYQQSYSRPPDSVRDERSSPYGKYSRGTDSPRSNPPSVIPRHSSVDFSRSDNIYAPPHSPHSSPDSASPPVIPPTPTLRIPPPAPQPAENRGSMSSNEIQVTIEPPVSSSCIMTLA